MNFKIGIVGWNIGENSFGITKPYGEFFNMFGDVIVLGPMEGTVEVDLLVLPGGQDISSHLYGRKPSFYNSNADLMKEFFMQNNLHQYIENDTPVFGICLGMQQIGVHFGGKMRQNIYHAYSEKSRDELVHELEFAENFEYLKGPKAPKKYSVNSLHHQALDVTQMPHELDIVAVSKDGYPEIIKHVDRPIWGVQYHPEEIVDTVSCNIIKGLLQYAEAKAV